MTDIPAGLVIVPGDHVLIGCAERLTAEEAYNLKDELSERFPDVEFTIVVGTSWIAKAPPVPEPETEWCSYYGGPDPDNAAGVEIFDDEAAAAEDAQWRRAGGSGVAKRTVQRGPWQVTG